jgi:hypothetical protein
LLLRFLGDPTITLFSREVREQRGEPDAQTTTPA